MKNWEDFYSMPLRMDQGTGWVYDDNDNFVLQFEVAAEGLENELLEIMNGVKNPGRLNIKFEHKNGYILSELKREYMLVRGWGHLTNVLKLSDIEAVHIQNTFADFLVSKLNYIS